MRNEKTGRMGEGIPRNMTEQAHDQRDENHERCGLTRRKAHSKGTGDCGNEKALCHEIRQQGDGKAERDQPDSRVSERARWRQPKKVLEIGRDAARNKRRKREATPCEGENSSRMSERERHWQAT
jgi:hypothetical protein